MGHFLERHTDKIQGVLSCLDRIVLTGTLPGICYAEGMSLFLRQHDIRIFDYTQWAEPLREEIRANAERLAADNDLNIHFIKKKNFRKEPYIAQIIKQRGSHPGLVHIFSAMESCSSYKPWHDKKTHRTYLKPDSGRCLHYYFYFILPEIGLCYLRVPTWAPFRLQFYCNGHNMLASKLENKRIGFKMLDNAFVQIDDFVKAQRLADSVAVKHHLCLSSGNGTTVQNCLYHCKTGIYVSILLIPDLYLQILQILANCREIARIHPIQSISTKTVL